MRSALRPASMRLKKTQPGLDLGEAAKTARPRSLSPMKTVRSGSLPGPVRSDLASAGAAAAAAGSPYRNGTDIASGGEDGEGNRGRTPPQVRRQRSASNRALSPSILKSLFKSNRASATVMSPHQRQHSSDHHLHVRLDSAATGGSSGRDGLKGWESPPQPRIRRLLGKHTGVPSFLRKRKKSVPLADAAAACAGATPLPRSDTQPDQLADDLHLGTVAGHTCGCAHIDIVQRHNSILLPMPGDDPPPGDPTPRGSIALLPARGVLCHIMHKCAVLAARPHSGSTVVRRDCPNGGGSGGSPESAAAVVKPRALSRNEDEDGDEFFDAQDADTTPEQALAVGGPWDVSLSYLGSRYSLRVTGGQNAVPAACLVAEVMRTAMEMEGKGAQCPLDGLKLQDSVTRESFRMSDVLSRRDAAGRLFWVTQRGRLSQPTTPVGTGAAQGPLWAEGAAALGEEGDEVGTSTSGCRRSMDGRPARRLSGLTGEFSLPNMSMEELKGADLISETVGRASVWIPDKAPTGLDRFSCPATAIDKLVPGEELSNCWEEPPSETFMVRGKNYLKDAKKVPSEEAAYLLLGLDLLLSVDQHHHVAARPGGFVQRFRRKSGPACPFVLVLNFALPWGSFVAYFAPRHGGTSPYVGDAVFDGLMKRLLEEGDDDNFFRNNRIKIIPRCHDGPWLVRSTVGGKPAIIGTKITQHYFRGPGYFEILTDVCSSTAALYILGVVKNYTKVVSVDLGFVIQGESEEELPERLIGALRFHHLDVAGALSFETWESRPGAVATQLHDRGTPPARVKSTGGGSRGGGSGGGGGKGSGGGGDEDVLTPARA